MISTSDFKRGLFIKFENELYVITECQFYKPGKGGGLMRTKLKSLKTGFLIDKTFRSGDTVEDVYIENKALQYMYASGGEYHFMDTTTYEQLIIGADIVGGAAMYLKENAEITVSIYEGKVMWVTLPTSVNLVVAETEPGVKGDTAKGGTKPAKLETGASVQVPLFVKAGDLIKVDTRTGEYLGRA